MRGRFGGRVVVALVAGALLAGAGVGVSSGLVTLASQPQPQPTVAVTPSTQLVDLQSVLVVGSDFSPNATIASVECAPGAVTVDNCDLSTAVYANADANGAFTSNRVVRRLIEVGGSTVDCAAPTGCILGAGNIANYAESSGMAISFDPSKPPVTTKIVATPSTNLRDHQLVTVTGQGFFPATSVSVLECLTSDNTACAYETQRFATTGTNGGFTMPNFAVEREISTYGLSGPEVVDCAVPGTCELVVGSGSVGAPPTPAPLSFNPVFPPAVPAITVTPATGLADLQVVTVRGSGFLPGSPVSLSECSPSAFTCDTASQSVTPGFRGQFLATMTLRRRIALQNGGGSALAFADCVVASCEIDAASQSSPANVSAPVSFDPRKPSVVPSASVIPNSGLSDDQAVNVTLHGFGSHRSVLLVECVNHAAIDEFLSNCDGSTLTVATTPAGGGDPTASIFVHSAINSAHGLVDCTQPGACVLVATTDAYFGYFTGGVAAQPAAAAPSLQLPASVHLHANAHAFPGSPHFAPPGAQPSSSGLAIVPLSFRH